MNTDKVEDHSAAPVSFPVNGGNVNPWNVINEMNFITIFSNIFMHSSLAALS